MSEETDIVTATLDRSLERFAHLSGMTPSLDDPKEASMATAAARTRRKTAGENAETDSKGSPNLTMQDRGDYSSQSSEVAKQKKETLDYNNEHLTPRGNPNQTQEYNDESYPVSGGGGAAKLSSRAAKAVLALAEFNPRLAASLAKTALGEGQTPTDSLGSQDVGQEVGGEPDAVADAQSDDGGGGAATPSPPPPMQGGDPTTMKLQEEITTRDQKIDVEKQVSQELKKVLDNVTGVRRRTAADRGDDGGKTKKDTQGNNAVPHASHDPGDHVQKDGDPDWTLFDQSRESSEKTGEGSNGQAYSDSADRDYKLGVLRSSLQRANRLARRKFASLMRAGKPRRTAMADVERSPLGRAIRVAQRTLTAEEKDKKTGDKSDNKEEKNFKEDREKKKEKKASERPGGPLKPPYDPNSEKSEDDQPPAPSGSHHDDYMNTVNDTLAPRSDGRRAAKEVEKSQKDEEDDKEKKASVDELNKLANNIQVAKRILIHKAKKLMAAGRPKSAAIKIASASPLATALREAQAVYKQAHTDELNKLANNIQVAKRILIHEAKKLMAAGRPKSAAIKIASASPLATALREAQAVYIQAADDATGRNVGGNVPPDEQKSDQASATVGYDAKWRGDATDDEISHGTDDRLESPETASEVNDARSTLNKRHNDDVQGSTTAVLKNLAVASSELAKTIATVQGLTTTPQGRKAIDVGAGSLVTAMRGLGEAIQKSSGRQRATHLHTARVLFASAKAQNMLMKAMFSEAQSHKSRFQRVSPAFKLASTLIQNNLISPAELPAKVGEFIRMGKVEFETVAKTITEMAERTLRRGLTKNASRLPSVYTESSANLASRDELDGVFDE